jgi:FixJ family two-component response regulator
MRVPAGSRTIAPVNLTQTNQRDVVDRHGHVVILVEDDAGLRGALERVLRASGFEAQSYASAEAALADHRLESADCLVVDLNLPAMSGLDLVDRVRRHGVTVPTVLITAHDEPRVRDEVTRRGIQHFLAKPFLGSALVRLLDSVIAGTSNDAPAGIN